MRHGNRTCPTGWLWRDLHFDPTYEAWKQLSDVLENFRQPVFRSYLWGMETQWEASRYAPDVYDFDPTYEAWKQYHQIEVYYSSMKFRSYLWGMETTVLNPHIVRTLSTFRSYLWGMETQLSIYQPPILVWFRSYLWGMETWFSCPFWKVYWTISILPMRHGNI